jgi:molybdopterin converting factor small subunit
VTAPERGVVGVRVVLPSALGEVTGGARHIELELAAPSSMTDVLAALGRTHPLLVRRLCDESGNVRRFVNVYVDGVDIRGAGGLATSVADGAVVDVLPSIAGG